MNETTRLGANALTRSSSTCCLGAWLPYSLTDDAATRTCWSATRSNDGTLLNNHRAASVLEHAWLLWTLPKARKVRAGSEPARAEETLSAWDWVRGPLTDAAHGGVFWSVDTDG
jgi:hypothetical protein